MKKTSTVITLSQDTGGTMWYLHLDTRMKHIWIEGSNLNSCCKDKQNSGAGMFLTKDDMRLMAYQILDDVGWIGEG